MNNISFQSRIKPLTQAEFDKALRAFSPEGSSVYPWTTRQTVYTNRVYTRGICSCTACLIKDDDKALLLHLNPDMEENNNFEKIFDFIKQKINVQKSNLEAFLTGSNNNSGSYELYQKFKEFLNKYKIPVTELQHAQDSVAIAYRTDKDEILVSVGSRLDYVEQYKNAGFTDREVLNKCFRKVSVSECDEI